MYRYSKGAVRTQMKTDAAFAIDSLLQDCPNRHRTVTYFEVAFGSHKTKIPLESKQMTVLIMKPFNCSSPSVRERY